MRVLITGGSGYIGREVAKALIRRGDTPIIFDTVLVHELHQFVGPSDKARFAEGDITDLAGLVAACQKERPDAVIHCAAIVGVLFSISSPSNVVRVNIQGSINVFEAMRLGGIRRVVHMSTEETYGDFVSKAAKEDDTPSPKTAYGITKLSVEHLGRSYRDLHGLDPINMRTSWVYGVGLPRPRAPTTFIDAALEGKSYHLNHGGDAAIDFTYMTDVVDGILCALDAKNHRYDVYNLASGEATTLKQMVATIQEAIPGAKLSVADGPYRFSESLNAPVKGALDITRAKEIGFTPKFNFRRGVDAYIEEWRKRSAKIN